ncbi:MAG: hypothetical protein Q8M58_04400 [Anaerolineales bacterium]|nr:hypothetical protein [Anaerolineales bacterium]
MKHETQTVFDVQPDRHPVPFQPFHPNPRRAAGWHHHPHLARFRLHTQGKTISADERCWPEMLRVHFRDGGSKFSIITAKYIIRKSIGPLWRLRMKVRLAQKRC